MISGSFADEYMKFQTEKVGVHQSLDVSLRFYTRMMYQMEHLPSHADALAATCPSRKLIDILSISLASGWALRIFFALGEAKTCTFA